MKHIIDDLDKNKYEAYTKQEVLEVIQEAISSGELPEEINGLVLTFKNPVDNEGYKIAFCTQAKYNELEQGGQLEVNCYYFITDDSTFDDWNTIITDLQNDFEELRQEVEEAIDTGLRYKLTNIDCAFDFSYWNQSVATDYSSLAKMNVICLDNDTSHSANNRVNIFPVQSNGSIAEARVEYVSGDDGYIQYSLETISQNANYIVFNAKNISNTIIYSPNNTSTYGADKPSRSTTFRIYVKDIYGTEFTKEFTINYKAA